MTKRLLQFVVVAFALITLFLPFIVGYSRHPDILAPESIYRMVGLDAMALLSFQTLLGIYLPALSRLFGRSLFPIHLVAGLLAYLAALTHPVLYWVLTQPGWEAVWVPFVPAGEYRLYTSLGTIALYLLTLTVAAGLLRRRFSRWRLIHWLNYVVFPLVWIKTWQIGSDVQTTPLRYLWLVWGGLFLAGLVYRFGPRFLRAVY
jgi:methionine sulfoxide reductase heme-binding subunit